MKTEPNKLETQIKEQLNAREIQPSEMAWDRLDAMLSVAEEKKTRRFGFLSFQSIGIAASVLVLISLGLFFFNQKETVIKPENNVVVNEEVKQNDSKEENATSIGNTGIDNDGLKEFNQQEGQVATTTINKQQVTTNKSSSSFNQNNQKTSVNPIINPKQEVSFSKQEAVAQKELPVVEPQKELVSNPSTLNVDNLLASVQKTPKSNAKVKVNANSLLSQVDGELDQSFREKVLTKISKNYQEVKVAIATRNQQ